MTKVCSKCGVEKDIEEFGIQLTHKDGRCSQCRACGAAAARERRRNPPPPKPVAKEGYKFCQCCGAELPLDNFKKHKYTKDGFDTTCRPCANKKNREALAKRRDSHLANRREYYKNNIEKERKRVRDWHRENYEKCYPSYVRWRQENKERRRAWGREYFRKLKAESPEYNIAKRIRSRVHALGKGIVKSKATLELIGCTLEEFRAHIENQFVEGMNWDNFCTKEVHMDHWKPIYEFDMLNERDVLICFNYRNYRPLFAIDNLRKNKKWSEADEIEWLKVMQPFITELDKELSTPVSA